MMNKMVGDDADDATDDGDVSGDDNLLVMTTIMMEDVMTMKLMRTIM